MSLLLYYSNTCVKTLLEYGADPQMSDRNSKTPMGLFIICDNPTRLRCLIDGGISPNSMIHPGINSIQYAISCENVEMVKYLISLESTDINHVDSDDWSSYLHNAAGYGLLDIMICLIDAGVNPDIVDENGKTFTEVIGDKLVGVISLLPRDIEYIKKID